MVMRDLNTPLRSVFASSDGKSLCAVGNKGTILESSDGEHWNRSASGTTNDLYSVFGTSDGKRLWAVGGRGTILESNGGEHWNTLTSGTTNNLNSVFGTSDGKRLWAVGDYGTILESSDGESWKALTSGTTNNLNSVFGASDGKRLWAVGESGTILESSDGEHWKTLTSGTTNYLSSVFGTSDGKRVWAVGGNGTILESSDGEHWNPRTSGTTSVLRSVFGAADGKRLWVVGGGGTILESSDGEHWIARASGTKDPLLSAFGTSDGKRLWAVGDQGTILESSDGALWNARSSGTMNDLYSVFGTNDGKRLWAVGDKGTILESNDGVHWTTRASGTMNDLSSVFGTNDGKRLWAVGDKGTILESSDGEHWNPHTSGTTNTLYSVFGTSDGERIWAVGEKDTILESSDGEHWNALTSGTTKNLFSVFGTSDGKRLWAVGDIGTILESSDGKHWNARRSGTTNYLFSVFGIGDGKQLWAVGANGAILESSDGEHWSTLASGTTDSLRSVFATSDGTRFWAVGDHATVVIGAIAGVGPPFISGATIFGQSLSIALTCPEGTQAQSVDLSASSDDMLNHGSPPKPVGTLQVSQSCKVSDFQFDPQALNLTSGAKVHFFAALHLNNSIQNYSVDAAYQPWLVYGFNGGGSLGVILVAASLTLLVLHYRLPALSASAAVAVPAPTLDKPEYRDVETILAERQFAEEEQFVRNLKDDFLLRSFELTSVRFFEDCAWEFRPRVNVLLGKNGYGKTLLLRALAATIQCDLENGRHLLRTPDRGASVASDSTLTLRVERNGEPEETVRDLRYFPKTAGKIPLLAVPDSRFVNRQIKVFTPPGIVPEPLCRSGAKHFLTQEPYENKVLELLYNLCLDYNDSGKSFDRPIFRILEQVCRQLTDDDRFAFHSISRVAGTNGYEIFVRTAGNENEPLPIQYASQGTLSVLVIFGQIYYFLETLHSNIRSDSVSQEPGIVILDEIDAHLHPSWQQKIMGILTACFPNVQFIVSAHSPLIVAGCDRNEVSVLRRRPNTDRFYVEVLEQDFLGAKAQDLYKLIFEIEDIDRLYLEYSNKAASGDAQKVERQIELLESKPKLTADEEALLDDLWRQARLLKRAVEVREERLEGEAAHARVERLESEIERLKNELGKQGGTLT
jgi:photosystem II stability/assembly factor-like uncharacterized protein/predicted ATPase